MSYITDKFDEKVVGLLKDGKVGLLPTDTIYGLSAIATNQNAVEKIHKLKKRDSGKPLIVLIANIEQLKGLKIDPSKANIIKKYWPAAISLEFQTPEAPIWLHRGLKHFAIRMPDHPELLRLIDRVGPIVSSSANLQGESPVNSIVEAKSIFGDQLDFYVDAGELNNHPSTLVELKNNKLKVVRQGAVKILD